MKLNKKLISNVLNLLLSNSIALFIGVLASFITPYVLGHQEYGYYKIFILYSAYVPLLHVGFIDGMLVRNAGKTIDEIDSEKFRTYTRFFCLFELTLSIVAILMAITMCEDIHIKKIIIYLSVYSLLYNLLTYFQFFSRCVMHFSQLAKVSRYQSYITFLYLILAYIIYKFSSVRLTMEYYEFFLNLTLLIVLCWFIYNYKKIVFGTRKTLKSEKNNIISFFKIGFSVMISYQITMFIINADNQFISMFFKVKQYASYAFSYSMASLLLTFFSAVSSVILPYMKKKGKKEILNNHKYYLSLLCMIAFIIVVAYYPIVIIVKVFMPAYAGSLAYLKIIFPEVGITCIIQSYIFNSYILIDKVKSFCLISLLNLFVDFMTYYILYRMFASIFVISFSSVLMIFLWYVSLELYLRKIENVKIIENILYIAILTVGFIIVNNLVENLWLAFSYYIVFYLLFSIPLGKKLYDGLYIS